MGELRRLESQPERLGLLAEMGEWLATGWNVLAPEPVVHGEVFGELPVSLLERIRRELPERSLVSRAAGGTGMTVSPSVRDGKSMGVAELASGRVLHAM